MQGLLFVHGTTQEHINATCHPLASVSEVVDYTVNSRCRNQVNVVQELASIGLNYPVVR